MPDFTTQKKDIRERSKQHRLNLRVDVSYAEDACALFLKSFPNQNNIALYYPVRGEMDTTPLFQELSLKHKTPLLPITQPNTRILKFAFWNAAEDSMAQGAYGIPAPKNPIFHHPEIIVTPLLAFDPRGNRLGYGGGYYDATVHYYRTDPAFEGARPIIVGYAYDEQAVLFHLPIEKHDEKLDYVVTPTRILSFL
jgi:5-formyltetrahydrofolate cyclo-ligase